VVPDERAWSEALRSWFFRPDLAGRSAYLAVDEETLTAIAREQCFDVLDATQSLCRVVRYRVSPRSPLGWWVSEAIRWRAAGSESGPPFLSVLALTVLAATIDDGANDRRYYRRMNKLLGLPGDTMPRDFYSDIQQLWTYLNEWLTETCQGQLGTATATNVGGQANVGWAQSQTLLRPSDRVRLPLFFTALGAHPGQLVKGDLLVRRLRSWSAGERTFSQRLAAVLKDPSLSELLAAALHSELAHWDGTLRDEAGRVALKLLLAFHERSGQLQAAVQVPEQLAGTEWQSGPDTRVSLGAAGELQLVNVPVTADLMDGLPRRTEFSGPDISGPGHRVRNHPSTITLVMPRRDVHLLCPDDRLARWVDVPSALLQRPHLVLVRSELAAAAVAVIAELGDAARPFRRIRCPSGWAAFRFAPTRLAVIDGPLAALSPRGTELSALEGGLPISQRTRIYLTDGAPDLVLDLREQSGLVTVDGAEASPDTVGRVRLADLGLSAGRHSVNVGGVRYQVTLVDEFARGPRDAGFSFAFNVRESPGGTATIPVGVSAAARHGPSDVMVSGAAIAASPAAMTRAPLPRPARVRVGGRHFVLGRPGQVVMANVQPPQWLRSLPVRLAPHLADVAPALRGLPFAPEWLLRVAQSGNTVSALPAGPQIHDGLSAANSSAALWLQVLPYIAGAVAETGEAALWSQWQQAALDAR